MWLNKTHPQFLEYLFLCRRSYQLPESAPSNVSLFYFHFRNRIYIHTIRASGFIGIPPPQPKFVEMHPKLTSLHTKVPIEFSVAR